MTIITICGDVFKYEHEITYITEQMTCSGQYCVFTPVMPFVKHKTTLGYTATAIGHLNEAHRKKIELSSAILVMDVDGRLSDLDKCWVEYAQKQNKQVLYYSQEIKNWR